VRGLMSKRLWWQCIQRVGELVKGKVLVGHALQNDLQVPTSCSHQHHAHASRRPPPCLPSGDGWNATSLSCEPLTHRILTEPHC
jgi:hypothetical protein